MDGDGSLFATEPQSNWMGGWMDGWMCGWMGGWVGGWMMDGSYSIGVIQTKADCFRADSFRLMHECVESISDFHT